MHRGLRISALMLPGLGTALNVYFFLFNLYLVILFFWLHWVLVALYEVCLVAVSRGYSSLRAVASHRSGFSRHGAQALGTRASVVAAHGLSSCGARAW